MTTDTYIFDNNTTIKLYIFKPVDSEKIMKQLAKIKFFLPK